MLNHEKEKAHEKFIWTKIPKKGVWSDSRRNRNITTRCSREHNTPQKSKTKQKQQSTKKKQHKKNINTKLDLFKDGAHDSHIALWYFIVGERVTFSATQAMSWLPSTFILLSIIMIIILCKS